MVRKPALLALLAALSFSSGSGAAEPRIGKYVSYDAGAFSIITDRSADQAREFMSDLAKFRVTLEKTLGKHAANVGTRTHILIVSHTEWEKYLKPRENIVGWFQPSRFANYMVMDGDADRFYALRIIFHEYTHFYLRSQFAGEYPPWFNEGLAEVMGWAKFTPDNTAILQIPMFRVYEARDNDWIPFERLIHVDHNSPEYVSHTLAESFYAQAWLTVHYGLIENREFGAQMLEYLSQLNHLQPMDVAIKNNFGDLAAVDSKLREYSRNTNMSSGVLKLGEIPAFTLPASTPVAELDALAVIIDLMLETRLAPDRIQPLIESLKRREPRSARAAVFAARLALARNDNAAFDSAVTAAEAVLTPEDWTSRRELALALLTSALDTNPMNTRSSADSERDLKRALKWFGEALTHNSGDVEALWGFGTTATRLDRNLDLAEQALLAAYQLAPTSADIAFSIANVKSRKQEPDETIPYLKDAIRYATDLNTRQAATQTLEQTERYIAERDKNDAEYKKQREEYEKKLADYEKKHGKKKK